MSIGGAKETECAKDDTECEAEDTDSEEPAEEESAGFSVDNDLLQEAGGPAPKTSEVNIDELGNFEYREFESKDALFAYVKQEGYGWDPELPSICFAFQVTENEDKNKYELEMFFRDQWPVMYNTIPRLDREA